METQLVAATLRMKIEAKNPPVLRPAPFAEGGHWGIYSCAVLYDGYMNYFAREKLFLFCSSHSTLT